MDDTDLRVRAMDFAIAARTSGEQDIVELAKRIYAFLSPFHDALTPKGEAALKAHVAEIQSEQCIPPPIPHQDLGKADQTPVGFDRLGNGVLVREGECQKAREHYGVIGLASAIVGLDGQIQSSDQLKEAFRASVAFEDDDVPTRLVR